ncbi:MULTISPECIES: acyl carrier protein [Streptomyces]|uniref:Phosphopantetheine-binding protein n=1 Tax=Streptomyces pratisoli TaxID=3139917 RepID=A0ACC6QPP8_9ACTN|nr:MULTISPECIES: phosphopantetheine-binding protein [unclassified Streptomyces]MCX4515066.1 phosphopantetheine-binding protein [Streptomyces sp. NBC_01619]
MSDVQSVAALDRVRGIVAEVLEIDIDSVEPDASFYDDLAADSLEKVEIAVRVEREFAIPVSPQEAAEMTSASAVLALLRDKGKVV